VRAVSGLITGLHDPQASHLTLLKQVTATVSHGRDGDEQIGAPEWGSCHLERAYAEARQRGYRWHEFGDSHLILGRSAHREVAVVPRQS
jgi:S-adenosylmethionine:tRNA ribosyltransferase-isomerase